MTKGEKYNRAYAEALDKARKYGRDYGIEWNAYMLDFRVFGLPKPENRYGHELRCEVVRPSDPAISPRPNRV